MKILILIIGLFIWGCEPGTAKPYDTDTNTSTTGQREATGLNITPVDPFLTLDEIIQLKATLFFSDTTNENVTNIVQWTVIDTQIVSISSAGLCKGLKTGSSRVIATHQESGKSREITVTVTDETPSSIAVSPTEVEMKVDDQVQLVVSATYNNDKTGNITGSCEFSPENSDIVSVDDAAPGLLTGKTIGSTNVVVNCGSHFSLPPVPVTVVSKDTELSKPDLLISDFTASVIGNNITYLVEITNVGEGNASASDVVIFLHKETAPTALDTGDTSEPITSIAAGNMINTPVDFEVTYPGTYQSYVYVDMLNFVEEDNEFNNIGGPITVTVENAGEPDIIITNFEGTTDCADPYSYWTFQIENQGTAPTIEDFFVDIFPNKSSEPVPGDISDGGAFIEVSINPGESISGEYYTDSCPSGTFWTSWALADGENIISESNESNNATSFVLTEDK